MTGKGLCSQEYAGPTICLGRLRGSLNIEKVVANTELHDFMTFDELS